MNVPTCPKCKNILNAATPVENIEAVPKPDDFSVCIHCASMLRFDENLELRLMTKEDFDDLDDGTRASLGKAVRAIKRVQNMN